MRILIALGGNAILRRSDEGSFDEQVEHAREILDHVATLAADEHLIILTHGNGPIVGNILMRNEAARDLIEPMPLFVDGADSQGGIGFLLQSVLGNQLRARRIPRAVVTTVTQVVVDAGDPAFHRPTKPIGPRVDERTAERLARDEGWYFVQEEPNVFRRVVPSPEPRRVVESSSIDSLASGGVIVIACGGGGVPVMEADDGSLKGIDAVIDKDLASSLLAIELEMDIFAILMEADGVYLGWGTPDATCLGRVSAHSLRSHLEAGAFAEGSMAPKVEAACRFVEQTGRDALIGRADGLAQAIAGTAGTRVTST